MNDESNSAPMTLENSLLSLQAKATKLKSEYQDVQNTEKFLIGLSNALTEKIGYTYLLNVWEKQQDTIRKCLRESITYKFEIDELIEELKQQRLRDMQEFAQKFPTLAESFGLKIDAGSRHPNYYFMNGFIHICANEKKFQVAITPRMGKTILLGPEFSEIFRILNSEVQRIFKRQWDSSAFRKKLLEIYNLVSPRNTESKSPEVEINSIIKEFKYRHKMNPDEFLIDFSRLLKEDKSIRLGNARGSENGIQIVGSESNGYYGYMRIEE